MTHEASAWLAGEAGAGLWEAVVMEATESTLTVRAAALAAVGSEARVAVRNAQAGYAPAAGDQVLVLTDPTGAASYVVGVLSAVVRTAGGASASVEGERVLLRQADGAVVVEFDARTGQARVLAPGDLALAAPKGRITFEAMTDVTIVAGRRVVQRVRGDDGARSELSVEASGVKVAGPALDVTVESARAKVTDGSLHAARVSTTVERLTQTVTDWELRADKVTEHARTVYREVEGLLQTRARRARTIVQETLHMVAGRTRIRSKEDTSVDGRRVLLG
jgi:hypothetical protein